MNMAQHNRKNARRWSQNFLTDKNIARKIVDSLNIQHSQVVLEIGPGQGILTQFLIQKADQVVAVEVDPQLSQTLPERLSYPQNLKVVHEDFLKMDIQTKLSEFSEYHKSIIGNLPYHITTPILFKILDYSYIFQEAVFMVQREVGERITASPGSKIYGIPSVLTQFYAHTDFLFTVPSHLFRPRPEVESGVIHLDFKPAAEQRLSDPQLFRKILKTTFGKRRKMLRNTLSELYSQTILDSIDFDLTRRPETCSVEEFVQLTNQLEKLSERSRNEQNN